MSQSVKGCLMPAPWTERGMSDHLWRAGVRQAPMEETAGNEVER